MNKRRQKWKGKKMGGYKRGYKEKKGRKKALKCIISGIKLKKNLWGAPFHLSPLTPN